MEDADSCLRLCPHVDGKLPAMEDDWLLLSDPVVDATSTVDDLAVHPAEFGNHAKSTTLWKSQKWVGDMDKIQPLS